MKLDPSSGKVSEHHTRIRTEPLRGCNNLHCVTNGDLYFTDLSQSDLQLPDGRVFRLTPDDQLEYLIDCGVSPNLVGIGGECGRQYKQSSVAASQMEQAVGNIETVASAATQLSVYVDRRR